MIKKKCKIEDCNNNSRSLGLCLKHYTRLKRTNQLSANTDKNEIVEYKNYCEVILYKNHIEHSRCLIDKEDIDKISNIRWRNGNGYAVSTINKRRIQIANIILPEKSGFIIDHINRNPLDNRKENIRYATIQQNNFNISRKGYSYEKSRKKWAVQIKNNYNKIFIGRFNTEQEAREARIKAELKYHGEFSPAFCSHK